MAKTCFTVLDIAITTISLCSFVVDIGTDLAVCIQFLQSGLVFWGWMTLALVLVPAVIMNIFSLAWHIHDKTVTPLIIVFHLVLMAPVQRYFNVLHLGVKSRRSQKVVYSQKAWRAQNDVSILRLFEAFMESAPQLILQLFIMIQHKRVNVFTGLSAGASFLSLSWALTAYSDSLRRACKLGYHRRLTGLLLHWGWQLFMSLSRICAFVIFTYVLHKWVFVIMAAHWMLSFLWICVQGTDFGKGPCEKWMFRGVCAFIYIFMFLNLNDGISRYRITAYYVLMMIENISMVTVYFVIGEGDHLVLVSVAVFGGFFLGLICMLVYYGFLHPTKPAVISQVHRPLRSKSAPSPHTSCSSTRRKPIFSIDSPQSNRILDGTSVNLSLPASSLTSSNLLSNNLQNNALTNPLRLDQTLKHKWQSGMDSSCTSSSSSLASDQVEVKRERPSSRTSENSNDSDHSNNCLLLSASKNNLSKSFSSTNKSKHPQPLNKTKSSCDDLYVSDDMNVVDPESPSLSRCSWARSSDHTRLSMGTEEFVTLGFDCSSSIERRVSESSSANSRPKSLSPLNVSNLWQDARSKLRQTIAATIAAATGHPSSNEGTPNRSRSQSFMSHNTSSQDDSISSLNHNFGFMDSKSSYLERDRDLIASGGSGSLNSGRNRDALNSLPDIFESAENEQLSDTSHNVSIKKSPCQSSASPWFGLEKSMRNKGSPYPEDSTLTASKLGDLPITPVSFIITQQNRLPSAEDSLDSLLSKESENLKSSKDGSRKKKHSPGGSPFTDQELTSVMAKSLQSYTGAISSTDSTNKEREGLALTLEDLQYPIDLDNGQMDDQTSISLKLKDSMTKSRSTSSLFHDGEDSSPASSASKMQRVTELQKIDSDISPNAFKHLNMPSSYILHDNKSNGSDLKMIDDLCSQLVGPSTSNCDALKILMEAYGQLSTRSPQVTTPSQSKLSIHRKVSESGISKQRCRTLSEDFPQETSDVVNKILRINPDLKVFKEKDSEITDIRKRSSLPSRNFELFDSIAWQKSKLKAKQQQCNENTQAYAAQSSTKKLHVHSQKQVFELHDSPNHKRYSKSSPEDNEGMHYVEGKYRPPLYKFSNAGGDDSILNNLNQSQNDCYKPRSPKKEILTHSPNSSQNCDKLSTSMFSKPGLQRSILRKSLMHQEPDYFHLHDKDFSCKPDKLDLRSRYNSFSRDQSDQDLNSWDVNDARLVDSPQSYSRHQRSVSLRESVVGQQMDSFSQPVHMNSPTELELKISAKHVEDYFSQALKRVPGRTRPRKTISHPDLDIHTARQPLKPVQNSPQHNRQYAQYLIEQSQQFKNDDLEHHKRKSGERKYSKRLSLDSKFSG